MKPILIINAGSSSIKFSVFETAADRSLAPGPHGQVEGVGTSARFEVADAQGNQLAARNVAGNNHLAAIQAIHDWFATHAGGEIGFAGIGHRVVHGGSEFSGPVLIDARVLAALEALIPLAPLHQPHHIAAGNQARFVNPHHLFLADRAAPFLINQPFLDRIGLLETRLAEDFP